MIEIVKDQPRNNVPIHVLFNGMPRTPIHALAPPGINYGANENHGAIMQTAGTTNGNDGFLETNHGYFCMGTDQTPAIIVAPIGQDHQGYQCAKNRGEVNDSIMCASNNREGNLDGNAEFAAMTNCAPIEKNHGTYAFTGSNCNPVYCGPNAISDSGYSWLQ